MKFKQTKLFLDPYFELAMYFLLKAFVRVKDGSGILLRHLKLNEKAQRALGKCFIAVKDIADSLAEGNAHKKNHRFHDGSLSELNKIRKRAARL